MNVVLGPSVLAPRSSVPESRIPNPESRVPGPGSRHRNSPQCLVDSDDAGEHAGFGVGDSVLRLQLGAFSVEQSEKVSCTLPIPHAGDRGGAAALSRLLGQLHEALLVLAVADKSVLCL